MTPEELSRLTQEEKQSRIAALCGFTNVSENGRYGFRVDLCGDQKPYTRCSLPDYLHDLNACHDMEKMLSFSQRQSYYENLRKVCSAEARKTVPHLFRLADFELCRATAAQRADAFLLTV